MNDFYCPVCGTIHVYLSDVCEECKQRVKMIEAKHSYEYYFEKSFELYKDYDHNQNILIDEEVCLNPKFNPELAHQVKLKSYTEQTHKQIQQILKEDADEQHRINNDPKCPTCGSYNVKRISHMRRAAHAMTIGILSTTARSQFECLSCSYKW